MKFNKRYDAIAFSPLGASEKSVLYALNRYSNDEGESIYPSLETLEGLAGLSDKGLRLCLKKLQDMKVIIISKVRASNSISMRNDYKIDFEALLNLPVKKRTGTEYRNEPGPTTGTNRYLLPERTGTNDRSEPVLGTAANRNDVPVPIDSDQPIIISPLLTPPKGSKNFENTLPDEDPEPRDMQNPNQAPLSEKAGTSNALLKTSPKNSPVDSEKNGFEEGFFSFSSLQGQTEPDGVATPTSSASRSNYSEAHDKALEDADPYKDTENESGWRNARQDEKERHAGQLLQLIKTPPEEKREPKLAADFEKRGLKVPLESIATMEVWREHRKYHVKSPETPEKGVFDIVKSAYRQLSGEHDDRVADLVLLVEAANCCPYKPFSYDIRGQGWEDRGGFDRSGDLDTIFRHKKMPARLQSAKEWEEAGKPEEISAPNRRVGHEKFNLEGKFDSDPKWSKPIPGMEGVTMPGFDDEEFWAKYGPILGAT